MICPVCQLRDCSWTAEAVCEGTEDPQAVADRAARREQRRKFIWWCLYLAYLGGLYGLCFWISGSHILSLASIGVELGIRRARKWAFE